MSTDSPGSGRRRSTVHQPVMLREVLRMLDLRPGLVVVDGTVGAGGHSQHIHRLIKPDGFLLGLDRDAAMLDRAREVVTGEACELFQASYNELPEVLERAQRTAVDRILVDLGLSSDQLADTTRGFSFTGGGPLDLRFDTRQGKPAAAWIAELSESQLAELFQASDERHARRIAAAIVRTRSQQPITTAEQLAELVAAAVPGGSGGRRHPATRVFQALRIHANQELDHLREALAQAFPQALAQGGRLVVITFHSVEDRLVKQAFRDNSQWQTLTPKPLTPTSSERTMNPRCRTAKLRAVIRR